MQRNLYIGYSSKHEYSEDTIEDSFETNSIEATAKSFNGVQNEGTMKADTYLMDLQNMQKQLMDTMMLMMKNENQKQDRGSNIGTQININNVACLARFSMRTTE